MSSDAEIASATRSSLFVDLPPGLVDRVLAAPPFVAVPGVHNVRDVALCGADVPSTVLALRPGRVFRSATLHQIGPAGGAELRRRGIVKVFDLRSERERKMLATPPLEGVDNVWLPPAREPGRLNPAAFTTGPDGVPTAFADMYEDILDTHTPIYRAVFEHILASRGASDDQPSACLFHCQAGKDRTGVLAALILDLAGVPHATIAHDYSLTRIGLEPGRATLLDPHDATVPGPALASATVTAGTGAEASPAASQPQPDEDSTPPRRALKPDPRSADFAAGLKQAIARGAPQEPVDYFVEGMFRSDEASMLLFLDRLHKAHAGGAQGYLHTKLGFDQDQVEQIRSRLLL